MSYDPTTRLIYQESSEPTGFSTRTDTTLSFDSGTLTLSLAPTGPSFDVFIKGVRYVFDVTQTVVITDTEGLWYFYFDATGTLVATQTFSSAIITDYAYVAVLYWDATNNVDIYLGEERHGITMDGQSHLYLHSSVGSAYISGFGLANFVVDADGTLATHAQFSCADGVFHDEDIRHSVIDDTPQALSPTATLPIYFRTGAGASWRRKTADTFPLVYDGTAGYVAGAGRAPFNEFTGGAWQFTEVAQGNYFLMHYFATNDTNEPVVGVQGVAEYTTIKAARVGATTEINALSGLPFAEFVPLGSVIFQTSTTYSNAPASRIRTTDGGGNYIDFRPNTQSASTAVTDHGTLLGLNDLDHPASAIYTDTTNFTGLLSGTDTDVQAALETLDAVVVGGGTPKFSAFDHFDGYLIGTTRYQNMGMFTQNFGTGAVTTHVTGTTDHPGIIELRAGTTDTGISTLYVGNDTSVLFGGATSYVFETVVKLDSAPDGTEDFRCMIGWHDMVGGSINWLNGACFRIWRDINATNVIASTADNFSFTNVDTGVTLASLTAWTKFRIVMNAAGTSVEFFINDVSVAVITTNIPTTAGRVHTPAFRMLKLAGTTDRILSTDYLYLEWNPA